LWAFNSGQPGAVPTGNPYAAAAVYPPNHVAVPAQQYQHQHAAAAAAHANAQQHAAAYAYQQHQAAAAAAYRPPATPPPAGAAGVNPYHHVQGHVHSAPAAGHHGYPPQQQQQQHYQAVHQHQQYHPPPNGGYHGPPPPPHYAHAHAHVKPPPVRSSTPIASPYQPTPNPYLANGGGLPGHPSAAAAAAPLPSAPAPTPSGRPSGVAPVAPPTPIPPPQRAGLPLPHQQQPPQIRAQGEPLPRGISMPPESAPIIIRPAIASPPPLPPLHVPPPALAHGIANLKTPLLAPIAAVAGAIDPTAAGATTFTTGKDNIYDIQVNYRLHKCHVSIAFSIKAHPVYRSLFFCQVLIYPIIRWWMQIVILCCLISDYDMHWNDISEVDQQYHYLFMGLTQCGN
jgi:hypothetical protein